MTPLSTSSHHSTTHLFLSSTNPKSPTPYYIIWSGIYLLYLTLGLFLPSDHTIITTLKLLSIFLCLPYVCFYYKTDHLLQLAFLLTILADIALASNNSSPTGVLIFCFVQFCHLLRLSPDLRHPTKIPTTTRTKTTTTRTKTASTHDTKPLAKPTPTLLKAKPFLLTLIILLALALLIDRLIDFIPIYLIATTYGVTLLTNLTLSFLWHHSHPTAASRSALLGFLLFLCCDTCVALSFLSRTGLLTPALTPIVDYIAWVFYLPSQIFICNSSKPMLQ